MKNGERTNILQLLGAVRLYRDMLSNKWEEEGLGSEVYDQWYCGDAV